MSKKPAEKNKGGRPSIYSDAILMEICERLSGGEPLSKICRDEHLPCARTVGDWINTKPNVSAEIARARLEFEDTIAADCLEIADESGYDPSHGKLRVWTRLELLKRWNPKRWGDRVQQEVSGPGGAPLESNVQIIVEGV